MLNLDTHVVVDLLRDRLPVIEERLMEREQLGISAIVFWELESLVRLGRIDVDLDSARVQSLIDEFHVFPITHNVCRQLRVLDFRSDPADELIAATSIALSVPLLTRDERILRSRVVPFAIS